MMVGLFGPEGKLVGMVLHTWLESLHKVIASAFPSDLTFPGHLPCDWDALGTGMSPLSCVLDPPTSVLILLLPRLCWFHKLESFILNIMLFLKMSLR